VRGGTVTARLEEPTFEAWWEPYTLGVGPAGAYVATLDDEQREQLRQACLHALGAGPIRIDAVAWACVGRVARR
jgi:hypothetical protein